MINNKIKLKKNNFKYILLNKTIVLFKKSYNINKFWPSLIYVHKGNCFIKLSLHKYFKGIKVGDLIFTRKFFYFPKSLKKKKHIRR